MMLCRVQSLYEAGGKEVALGHMAGAGRQALSGVPVPARPAATHTATLGCPSLTSESPMRTH